MKNLKKRISAIALTAVAAAAMAMPSFADNDVTFTDKHHILSIERNKYLNLEGSGYAYKNRDVTVYSFSSDDDQNWYITNRGNGLKVFTAKASSDGKYYALNANTSTANCNIYPDIAANNPDSVVSTSGNASKFTISLAGGSFSGYELSVNPYNREVMWGSVDSYTWKLA